VECQVVANVLLAEVDKKETRAAVEEEASAHHHLLAEQ